MTYIITEPCIGVKDKACVAACPVECIYERDSDAVMDKNLPDMLFIHPEECIDCGACEPECPVEAIFAEDDVPEKWQEYIEMNYRAFGLELP